MGKETELKLELSPLHINALITHPLISSAQLLSESVTLENTYFDTSALDLQRLKMALRTRQQGNVWLQTVKCAGQSIAGVSQRPEWETFYNGHFDFSEIEIDFVRETLDAVKVRLQPIFSTNFERSTYSYKSPTGAEILLMIDLGKIQAQGQALPICELELELVKGDVSDLVSLAIDLAKDLSLTPSDISKAERGYRLFSGVKEQPVVFVAPRQTDDITADEVFRNYVSACLVQWQGNLFGITAREEPDYLLQWIESQERLLAVLRMFKPLLSPQWFKHWKGVLTENLLSFREQVELDYFADRLIPEWIDLEETESSLKDLKSWILAHRATARQEMMQSPVLHQQGCLILRLLSDVRSDDIFIKTEQADHAFLLKRLKKLRKRALDEKLGLKTLPSGVPFKTLLALKEYRWAVDMFANIALGKNRLHKMNKASALLGTVSAEYVLGRWQAYLQGLVATDVYLAESLQRSMLIQQTKLLKKLRQQSLKCLREC